MIKEKLEKEANKWADDMVWALVDMKRKANDNERDFLVQEYKDLQKRFTKELEAQIEKMKKYGKLLQDICVVLGNDNFMVAVQLESVVKKLWDTSEEKEGLKMVEDIENRLLKIKPQEWAEITKWEE